MFKVQSLTGQEGTGRRQRFMTRTRQRTLTFYVLVAPWVIGFVVLTVFPTVLGLATSFTNYDGYNLDNLKFMGVENYVRIFQDLEVSHAVERTVVWGVLNVPAWIILSFVLALILNQQIKGQGLFRTLYYLPSVIPAVVSVFTWKSFLSTNYGALNGFISWIRGTDTAIPWLTVHIVASATMIAVWQGVGQGMVVFLAGLQGIPRELEEAALIDGASKLQVFRYVTIPLMTPVIFFQLVMSLIYTFQTVNMPLLLGGFDHGLAVPPRKLYLYAVHIYKQVFDFQRYGYGTALSWLLFVVIVAITAIVFRTSRYWVYYQTDVEEETS